MRIILKSAGLILLFLGLVPVSGRAAEPENAMAVLADIPVQHNGRVKPFETFAREAVMSVTGKIRFEGSSPVVTIWKWMVEPEKWNDAPLLRADHPALAADLGRMSVRGRVSPQIVLQHAPFIEKVQAAHARREAKQDLSREDEKRLEIYERALLFQAIGRGELPGWVAHPDNPVAPWLSLAQLARPEGGAMLAAFFSKADAEHLRETLSELFVTLGQGFDSPESLDDALAFRAALENLFLSRGIALNRDVLELESRYNHLQPFARAWPLYAAAVFLLLLMGPVSRFRKISWGVNLLAWLFFAGGFALHTYGFYLRSMIAGRPPVSNMYESVIWVSWAIVLFALILSFFYRTAGLRLAAGIVASFALIVAQSFPALLDPFITPLVPVLRSNLWLTVHVLTITLSYGAFALAWGLGHGAVFAIASGTAGREMQDRLVLYLYRSVQIGVVLLASGTVLGGVWANYSWGRFWGWDPKETWALIALLGYLLVLHGRYAGWLGPFGFSMGIVLAFLGVLMAWYGVNYVLAAGLHSYGFGGGGLPYVLAFVFLDLLVLAVAGWKNHTRKKSEAYFAG